MSKQNSHSRPQPTIPIPMLPCTDLSAPSVTSYLSDDPRSNHGPGSGVTLSKRAQKRLQQKSALMEQLCCIFASQYTLENPRGPVSLGVAENSLMHAELKEYCSNNLNLESSDFTYGTALKGSTRLFTALSSLFDRYFNSISKIGPEHMVTGSGVGALLDQLIGLLCDEGDGVMIATPYYSGFDKDIKTRNGAVPIEVDLTGHEPSSPSAVGCFERKVEEFRRDRSSKGNRSAGEIKAMIVCNPHNPLGFCYSREALIEYCRFAQKYDIHLIVDEIYALSTYGSRDNPSPEPFTSILSIDVLKEAGCDPSRVHFLYGASKDFSINGFRIGVMVSKNADLCDAFTASALHIKVASPADALWSSLLLNDTELPLFVEKNRQKLTDAYDFATGWLRDRKIEYLPSSAGQFIFINLRQYLRQAKGVDSELEQETQLWLDLLDNGVYLAPGSFYHNPVPGWFRLTFTIHRQIMQVGLDRIDQVLRHRGDPHVLITPRTGQVALSPADVEALIEETGCLRVACF